LLAAIKMLSENKAELGAQGDAQGRMMDTLSRLEGLLEAKGQSALVKAVSTSSSSASQLASTYAQVLEQITSSQEYASLRPDLLWFVHVGAKHFINVNMTIVGDANFKGTSGPIRVESSQLNIGGDLNVG